MIKEIAFIAVGVFMLAILIHAASRRSREPVLPWGLSVLIGFFIAVAVVAVLLLVAYYVFHLGAQLIFLAAIPTTFALIVYIPRILSEHVNWTPNRDRDQWLNDWSGLALESIPLILFLGLTVNLIREHEDPNLTIFASLCSLFVVSSGVRKMRRR